MSFIDLSGTWMPDWGWGNTEINAGVSNVMDNQPPANGRFGNPSFGNGNTFPGTYDALGRYWFVGFTQSFGEG